MSEWLDEGVKSVSKVNKHSPCLQIVHRMLVKERD